MFGIGKIIAVLGEIRSELRRVRIVLEETRDIWKLTAAVGDPLGEVAPAPPASGEEVTPAMKGRRKDG